MSPDAFAAMVLRRPLVRLGALLAACVTISCVGGGSIDDAGRPDATGTTGAAGAPGAGDGGTSGAMGTGGVAGTGGVPDAGTDGGSFSGNTVTNTLLPYANAMKTEAAFRVARSTILISHLS